MKTQTSMNYEHLYRLTKADLKAIITAFKPHLRGSLYSCCKQDLVGEIKIIMEDRLLAINAYYHYQKVEHDGTD